jgi:hypothetical protein
LEATAGERKSIMKTSFGWKEGFDAWYGSPEWNLACYEGGKSIAYARVLHFTEGCFKWAVSTPGERSIADGEELTLDGAIAAFERRLPLSSHQKLQYLVWKQNRIPGR